MSFIKKIIHSITSRISESQRTNLICWYNRHAVHYFFDRGDFFNLASEIFFHRYTGKKAMQRRREQLKAIQQKDVINVAFQIATISKWKCHSVYKEMEQHPRFNPIIWIIANKKSVDYGENGTQEKIISACEEAGYTYTLAANWDELDKIFKPDIVFVQDQYYHSINMPPNAIDRLFCQVRYCFANSSLKKSIDFFISNISLFLFLENESVARESRPHLVRNGQNTVVSGHPIIDMLLQQDEDASNVWKSQQTQKKKIIWAPHWSINNTTASYHGSTFLEYADTMKLLAQKYSDKIQITFKPHPTLYEMLCQCAEWGKEKTDAYYNWWNNQENTQLETGLYKNLFHQSDAMIHDSGSFILEYLLMNKPCMYLKHHQASPHFNEMNTEALKCYSIGKSSDDIENFITQLIEDQSNDKLREKRELFIQNFLLPPNGKSAAQNIIDTILYYSDN